MNQMLQKRAWSFAGIFMVMLVLSMPFYSAQALAAVQITKNSGQTGIENYIDAKGDVWEVEALISGLSSGDENSTSMVDPKNVKLVVGDNEAQFTSCSNSPLGVVCKYVSPLSDGVDEVEYAFKVVYTYLNSLSVEESQSSGSFIRADGSAPTVSGLTVTQNKNSGVLIDFTVSDEKQGAPSVGIKTIEIVDADNGAVIQNIVDFGLEKIVQTYDYVNDGSWEGKLQPAPGTLDGEGIKRIKVVAEDWLGHKTENAPIAMFKADFIKPQILAESVNFTSLGQFLSSYDVLTSVNLDVIETSVPVLTAESEQVNFIGGNTAICNADADQDKLWHCTWKDVEVKGSSSSVALNVKAVDEYGNVAEQVVSKSFVSDSSKPQIVFFGTERQFEGKSYITNGPSRVYLTVNEDGSGMNIDGIRANLAGFGESISEAPTECGEVENQFQCYWEVNPSFTSSTKVKISLSKFQDNVGNVGDMPEVEVIVDKDVPKIENLEFYGVSEVGDKNYFQSNDRIKIKFKAYESSGLIVLAKMNNLVMDAETKFPESRYTEKLSPTYGWQKFDDLSCQRATDGTWSCEMETEQLKSGPQYGEVLELVITDTAGNEADISNVAKNMDSNGLNKFKFDLLGLSTEDNPDYWEVKGKLRTLIDFVDLDAARTTYARMPAEVSFISTNMAAKVLSMKLIPNSCTPVSLGDVAATAESVPQISRSLMYGGNFPEGTAEPKVTLILEFSPFDGRSLFSVASRDTFSGEDVVYNCKVHIFSQVGKNALGTAEVQDVKVTVPFAFSKLGAIDENLADKINAIKNTDFMKFANILSYLQKAIDWINYINNILSIVTNVGNIIDLISVTEAGIAASLVKKPLTVPAATALMGGCLSSQYTTFASGPWVDWVQKPLQVLSCNPQPLEGTWYGDYQKTVLDVYNGLTTRSYFKLESTSLYDNMYLSIIGMCIPGIIYNVEKAREIHCRKIVCYGTEVPRGIATIESCNNLYDLQMCEYLWGPLVDLSPLSLIGQLGKMFKAAFTSPLGLITITEVVACANFCFVKEGDASPALLGVCKATTFTNKALGIINTIVSSVQSRPDVTASPYCKMADQIKVDELAGGKNYGGAQQNNPGVTFEDSNSAVTAASSQVQSAQSQQQTTSVQTTVAQQETATTSATTTQTNAAEQQVVSAT